ncbi:hypothetical protein ACTFIV_001728 [Dictyostelium citrinum]
MNVYTVLLIFEKIDQLFNNEYSLTCLPLKSIYINLVCNVNNLKMIEHLKMLNYFQLCSRFKELIDPLLIYLWKCIMAYIVDLLTIEIIPKFVIKITIQPYSF